MREPENHPVNVHEHYSRFCDWCQALILRFCVPSSAAQARRQAFGRLRPLWAGLSWQNSTRPRRTEQAAAQKHVLLLAGPWPSYAA